MGPCTEPLHLDYLGLYLRRDPLRMTKRWRATVTMMRHLSLWLTSGEPGCTSVIESYSEECVRLLVKGFVFVRFCSLKRNKSKIQWDYRTGFWGLSRVEERTAIGGASGEPAGILWWHLGLWDDGSTCRWGVVLLSGAWAQRFAWHHDIVGVSTDNKEVVYSYLSAIDITVVGRHSRLLFLNGFCRLKLLTRLVLPLLLVRSCNLRREVS